MTAPRTDPPAPAPVRVLLVEDNADLAFAVASALEGDGYAVTTAGTGPDALRLAAAARPDLVVLDVMLPGCDGFEVLRGLRAAAGSADVPVLLLTARGAEDDKVRAFRLGADDYVTKPFGARELLARVGALLRRARRPAAAAAPNAPAPAATAATADVSRFGDVEVRRAAREVRRAGAVVPLTPKEFDLLAALLDRRGAVASRLELLREVWGYRDDVASRTVDIHVAELRRKLEASPAAPRHIRTVWKVGYRLDA